MQACCWCTGVKVQCRAVPPVSAGCGGRLQGPVGRKVQPCTTMLQTRRLQGTKLRGACVVRDRAGTGQIAEYYTSALYFLACACALASALLASRGCDIAVTAAETAFGASISSYRSSVWSICVAVSLGRFESRASPAARLSMYRRRFGDLDGLTDRRRHGNVCLGVRPGQNTRGSHRLLSARKVSQTCPDVVTAIHLATVHPGVTRRTNLPRRAV